MRLDIISFAVPYPPVYGGAIDSFFRLKAFAELGVEVHLHCFVYGDHRPSPVLEEICTSVSYYHRRGGISLISKKPFIMASRSSGKLVDVLASGEGAVLFDGMHTCANIGHPDIGHRPKYVRMHNIEWEYYLFLSQTSTTSWKRMHFRRESRKLRRIEQEVLSNTEAVFAISEHDMEYYLGRHPDVHLVMPFHQFEELLVRPGEGDYVLLHGDLSIDDNLASTIRLASLCTSAGVPVKIAGRSPSRIGLAKLDQLTNIELHLDVSEEDMMVLMRDAHVHIIDASITSGFKLKLISALFTARHVLARKTLVSKQLRSVVHTFSDSSEIVPLLQAAMTRPVSPRDIAHRKSVLLPDFSNRANAMIMADLMNNS